MMQAIDAMKDAGVASPTRIPGKTDKMTPEIEEFAKTLIELVRDASIQSNDMALRPTSVSPIAKRWAKAASDEPPVDVVRVVIPDIVDETIFYLLQAIDEGLLRIAFTDSNGKVIDLATQGHGELSGWYMGSGGWRAMYSAERFVDDFADLRGTETSGAEP